MVAARRASGTTRGHGPGLHMQRTRVRQRTTRNGMQCEIHWGLSGERAYEATIQADRALDGMVYAGRRRHGVAARLSGRRLLMYLQ